MHAISKISCKHFVNIIIIDLRGRRGEDNPSIISVPLDDVEGKEERLIPKNRDGTPVDLVKYVRRDLEVRYLCCLMNSCTLRSSYLNYVHF